MAAIILPNGNVKAELASSNIEAVLVLDASYSMDDSDKEGISREAMKMFVDMSSVQGDKIGVVTYTDRIMREKALLQITSDTHKNDLKAFIDGLERGPYTNLAVGLNEAITILNSGHTEGYVPLIILLADGNNDLNEAAGATEEQANQALQQGIQNAKEKGYPVYTIGLNADGTLNSAVLENMATETNGKFFLADSAAVLPDIVSQIFADHLNLKVQSLGTFTANGDYQDVMVNIPNSSVIEANISIMSNQPVEIKLVDPAGNEKVIPSEDVVLSHSNKYSMLKMIKPLKGDWNVKIKGVNQENISVNLVFNYDMQLKVEPLQESYKKGDTVSVKAFLESNGEKLASEELYKQMKATMLVTNKETNETAEIAMNSSGTSFEGSFKLKSDQPHELKIRAEDESFYRETDSIEINMNAVPQSEAQAEEKKAFPWVKVLSLVVGGILVVIILIILIKKGMERGKPLVGQLYVKVRDNNTYENESPQYRRLDRFKYKASFYEVMGKRADFKEAELIVFTRGNNNSLIVTNKSHCQVEKYGDLIEKETLQFGDQLTITTVDSNKTITVEYQS